MRGFLLNNWFFIVMIAICCLGHLFGHGSHGEHRRAEADGREFGEKSHKHAA